MPLSQSDCLEAEVGRERDCVIDLDVDALRQSSSYVSGSDIEGPFGIWISTHSDGIDEIGRKVSRWNILDVARLLIDFYRWCNQNRFFDGDRKCKTSKGSRLPIDGVSAVSVLLSVGAANTRIGQERKLLSKGKQFRRHSVDISVGGIRVLNRLHHERIIGSQYPADRNCGYVFELARAGRNKLCLDVEHVHAGEIEEWADGGIPAVRVIVSRKAEFDPVAETLFKPDV